MDPILDVVDPAARAKQLRAERQQQVVADVAGIVQELSATNVYGEAMQKLADLESANPGIAITTTLAAEDWNRLCWHGALAGETAAVLPACERAVALAPDDGGIRDSRGLARALTGDVAGAVADFEFAVQWAQEAGFGQDFVETRQAWIDALKAGKNPFDEATLQALQNE